MDSYVGKRLDGRYEIREIIGVGGMAVVYKAYDNIDDRIVAIKILKEEFLANEEFRRRFKNESKAIAVLSHPNIVKVYDVSFGDRLQYIVMEYIEGITLKEYIEQQKVINWKEAVHFTIQILRALQHAHDKGIVHRDVKPQNIMLLQNGNIKVTDFGIARFSRGETRTMTESAIGSVHYISPEQARGEITDDKADIYSVGVVLYEMITGRLPFESDSAVSVAIMQLQNEAIHPRDINPQVPVGLEQITLRAMQKSTKDRYQSAAEMLLDLDEFRRNPAVKFDYSYFVDKEPTKFIEQPVQVKSAAVAAANKAVIIGDEFSEEEEDDDEGGNKALPIIVGVLSALLAVILLIVIVLALFTDVFKSNKAKVPNFVGMDYATEIQGNEKYEDWRFNVTYVTSTTFKAGQVCKQDPAAGLKKKLGTVINLEVAESGKDDVVPDVVGESKADAASIFKSKMISNVVWVTEYDPDKDDYTVLRTDPVPGTPLSSIDGNITVYVSTKTDENELEVPNLLGLNYETNKDGVMVYLDDAIDAKHLKLGTVKTEDSDKEKGTIIRQDPKAGEKLTAGKSVDIVISNGMGKSSKVKVAMSTPSSGKTKFHFYLSNEEIESKTIICNGDYSYNVEGKGTQNFEVRIGDEEVKLYSCTIDFDKGTISNETSIGLAIVPSYGTKTPDAYIDTLSEAGLYGKKSGSGTRIKSVSPAVGEIVKEESTVTITTY